jgi:hypothetical protein
MVDPTAGFRIKLLGSSADVDPAFAHRGAHRWSGTSAEMLSGLPALSVFPLDRDSLIRAVDLLRSERHA